MGQFRNNKSQSILPYSLDSGYNPEAHLKALALNEVM